MTRNVPTPFKPAAHDQTLPQATKRPSLSWAAVQRRLGVLRWLLPAGLVLLVIAYEAGPATWIQNGLGHGYHLLADALVFGTIGPVLTFVWLDFLGRWLEERETSDLQAQILVQARDRIKNSRQLNDDALQALFAAGALIAALQSGRAEFPPDMVAQLEETERALHEAIEPLRAHLLD